MQTKQQEIRERDRKRKKKKSSSKSRTHRYKIFSKIFWMENEIFFCIVHLLITMIAKQIRNIYPKNKFYFFLFIF